MRAAAAARDGPGAGPDVAAGVPCSRQHPGAEQSAHAAVDKQAYEQANKHSTKQATHKTNHNHHPIPPTDTGAKPRVAAPERAAVEQSPVD